MLWLELVRDPELYTPTPPPEDGAGGAGAAPAVLGALAAAAGLVGAVWYRRRRRRRRAEKVSLYNAQVDAQEAQRAKQAEAWQQSPKPAANGKSFRKNKQRAAEEEAAAASPPGSPAPAGGETKGWLSRLNPFGRSPGGRDEEETLPRFLPLEPADPQALLPGVQVRLMGLSKAEYNGLAGIVRGPADRPGRVVVDVVLVDDLHVCETQELSLKPENLSITSR